MFCLRKAQFSLSLSNFRIAAILFLVTVTIPCISIACTTINSNIENLPTLSEEVAMAPLVIDLQDGFMDDLVVIQIDDQEIFRKKGVQTSLLLGYADSLEIEVSEGTVNVEITLPLRNLAETLELQVSKATYLGISIQAGNIQYRVADKPFGYM